MATFRKLANGNWQAIIRIKGHKPKYKTFPKKILAKRWANQQEEVFASQAVTPEAERTLLSAVIEKYISEITPRKRAQQSEKSHLRIISNKIGNTLLSDLTPDVIVDYVDDRLETVSADTVIKELNKLAVVVDAAIALWRVGLLANPVHIARTILKLTKTLKPGVPRDRRPTNEELDIFYNSKIGPLVEFIVETGMRRGEIARMLPDHIKGDVLEVALTKVDKPRRVPLSARAKELLSEQNMTDGNPVWGFNHPDTITHLFSDIRDSNKIFDLRLHDLKHEAVSRFFEKGMTIEEVSAITGNSWGSLVIYTNLKAENLAQKMRQKQPAAD